MPNTKPQQTLDTVNPWLNIVITHSKFIFSPFICLFSTVIRVFAVFLVPIKMTLWVVGLGDGAG